jgi:hypothetical protein
LYLILKEFQMSKSVRLTLAVLFVLFVAATFAAPAYADDGATRACTTSDNWFTKLFNPCVELDVPVSAPSVVTFDPAKWEKALADAEAYLRAQSNGNADPVDSSNVVKNAAWKAYCSSMAEPKFDVAGNPICE